MIVQDAYEVYLAYNLYLKPKTNDKKKKKKSKWPGLPGHSELY